MAGIILRGRVWHFRWVVPKAYRAVAGKREIHKSLKTDSRAEAEARAADYKRKLTERFEALPAGRSHPDQDIDALATAMRIAQGLGVPYRSAKSLASGRIEDILARIDIARETSPDADNSGTVAALLGGVTVPDLRLSQLADHMDKISADENRCKNPAQMRKWRNGNKRAMRQAITAIGEDILVRDFTDEHAMKYLLFQEQRVVRKEVMVSSVKRDIAESW